MLGPEDAVAMRPVFVADDAGIVRQLKRLNLARQRGRRRRSGLPDEVR
jgi:hypothetical protein